VFTHKHTLLMFTHKHTLLMFTHKHKHTLLMRELHSVRSCPPVKLCNCVCATTLLLLACVCGCASAECGGCMLRLPLPALLRVTIDLGGRLSVVVRVCGRGGLGTRGQLLMLFMTLS